MVLDIDFKRFIKCVKSHRDLESFFGAKARWIMTYRIDKKILIEGLNKIDGLSLSGPEAGFLAWVDCREAGLDTPGDFFINHAFHIITNRVSNDASIT